MIIFKAQKIKHDQQIIMYYKQNFNEKYREQIDQCYLTICRE